MPKVVLCRPRGGLNDTLCQIERCWSYCLEYNRKLILDSYNSGLVDDFSNYFEPRDDAIIYKAPDWLKNIASFLLPKKMKRKERIDIWLFLQGRYYFAVWNERRLKFVSKYTLRKINFSIRRRHRRWLLIHEDSGGGERSSECLKRLKFTKKVSVEIINRLSKIEKPYSAVHIRNTDYQTDYVRFFEDIAPKVKGKNLLVCSDDHACIEYARKYFVDSRIITISDIPDTGGVSLHLNKNLDRYETNLDALADLVALSLSDELHICPHDKGELSGYSMLARNLNSQKGLVWELLGRA